MSTEGEAQPGRNPILVAIVSVVEQGQDPKILHDVIGKARAELASLRPEIQRTISGLDPNVREACTPQITQVTQAMTLYEGGLDTVKRYFSDGQIQSLTWGGELIRRADIQLHEAMFNLRNAALLAMGPTDIPDYNFIHKLYEMHKRGEVPRDGNFATAIERMWRQATSAVEQAERQPASAERDIVAQAYKVHVDACELLRGYVREGREELLEKGMQDLRTALKSIRDIIPAIQMRLRTSVPTRSPMVNFVINMATELSAGNVADQALRDALDQLKANFEDIRRQFESLAAGAVESVVLREEAARVRDALLLEEAAINQMYRFFDTRQAVLLGDGCQKLVEAMSRLEVAQKTFSEVADREIKTLCLRCGHYNERDRRTCEKCGARIIQSAEAGVASTVVVSEEPPPEATLPVGENIRRLFTAVNQVIEEKITLNEFENEVAIFEDLVNQYADNVATRPEVDLEAVPEENREQVELAAAIADQVETEFKDAVAFCRDGLARYHGYIAKGQNKNDLAEGTRSIWEANKKLNKVGELTAELQAKTKEKPAETDAPSVEI